MQGGDQRTLLLSQGYEPLKIIGWQRAVRLIHLGKAEVVDVYDRVVRSVRAAFNLPAVIRLVNAVRRRRKRPAFCRRNIWLRDGGSCAYCGADVTLDGYTYDHVVPRSRGGRTNWTNVVASCSPCNARKADRTPAEAGLSLRVRPHAPAWLPVLPLRAGSGMPGQWAAFVA